MDKKKQDGALWEQFFSLERYFRSCMLAETDEDPALSAEIGRCYGLDKGERIALFTVFLGEGYAKERSRMEKFLNTYMGKAGNYSCVRLSLERFQTVMMILYHMEDPELICSRLGQTVQVVFGTPRMQIPVFSLAYSSGIGQLSSAFSACIDIRKWNLCCPAGTLLVAGIIGNQKTLPLKYPMALENHLRRAAIGRNREEFFRLLNIFAEGCRTGSYQPDDVREACVRFCMAVLDQARAVDKVRCGVPACKIMKTISCAVTWREIFDGMDLLYETLERSSDGNEHVGILIRRTLRMLEEYYSQGITLNRIAQQLGVSEEYLSSLFRKETGMTFKETMRRYQIARVKELLIQSDLRLNEIADMTGYRDAKYMSRVFREKTGMLPAEFRIRNR